MKDQIGIVPKIRRLITLRKEQLSSLHVMLHWVEAELDKIVGIVDRKYGGYTNMHASKMDSEERDRLKLLYAALEISPISMEKVNEFSDLLKKSEKKID